MAALIEESLGEPAKITPGARGEFTVLVDGREVARKTLDGFPEDDHCVFVVKRALKQAEASS